MTQCDPTDRSQRPKRPFKLTILGNNEDVDALLAGMRRTKVKMRCGCPCHAGVPGRFHCFSDCCDQSGVIFGGDITTVGSK